MADTKRHASELEREGHDALRRGAHLLAMADTIRRIPEVNAPVATIRSFLASLGFCVVHQEALAYAEVFMRDERPEVFGGDAARTWDAASTAITEALLVTNHPRLKGKNDA